ncbi:MAG: hypothetical protein ACK4SY_07585 [Pyrobaculum sp.]
MSVKRRRRYGKVREAFNKMVHEVNKSIESMKFFKDGVKRMSPEIYRELRRRFGSKMDMWDFMIYQLRDKVERAYYTPELYRDVDYIRQLAVETIDVADRIMREMVRAMYTSTNRWLAGVRQALREAREVAEPDHLRIRLAEMEKALDEVEKLLAKVRSVDAMEGIRIVAEIKHKVVNNIEWGLVEAMGAKDVSICSPDHWGETVEGPLYVKLYDICKSAYTHVSVLDILQLIYGEVRYMKKYAEELLRQVDASQAS